MPNQPLLTASNKLTLSWCAVLKLFTFLKYEFSKVKIFYWNRLASQKISGPILMISGHMDISRILGRELLATNLTIVKETARKMHTFDVIQHIWPQSIFGTTNCALVLVLFILLEVLCQDLPSLKSWEIIIFKYLTP